MRVRFALVAATLCCATACTPQSAPIATARQALAQPSWTQVANDSPSPRSGAQMAYDSTRGRVVLFGSITAGSFPGETWEWDGTRWSLVSKAGPLNRNWHAMVYDDVRHRVVMFGGAAGTSQYVNETWEWDGVTWTAFMGPAPSARAGAAMAFDSVRGRVVLFGGSSSSSNALRDTWERVGTNWVQVASGGPPARSFASMAFDVARNRTVMTGGAPGRDDTWEWDGATWTQADVPALTPRTQHAVAASDSVSILVGGIDEQGTVRPETLTRSFGTEQWTLASQAGPARSGHAVAWDPERKRFVLFGGRDASGALTSDTWEWNPNAPGWTLVADNVHGDGPSARVDHAMAYSPQVDRVVLVGGEADGTYYDDMWTWDGSQWSQYHAPTPPARAGHAMVLDPLSQELLLASGTNGSMYFEDVWRFDGTSWTLRSGTVGARAHFAFLYDTHRQYACAVGGEVAGEPLYELSLLCTDGDSSDDFWFGEAFSYSHVAGVYDTTYQQFVVTGGQDSLGPRRDTWAGESQSGWRQIDQRGVGMRTGHALVYDSVRSRVVSLGGVTQDGFSNSAMMFSWNGTQWTPSNVVGPEPRWAPAAAADSSRGKIVVFGGQGSTMRNDTWEWNGSNWTEVVPSQPSGNSVSMAYHAATGKIVLYVYSFQGAPVPREETWLWDGSKWDKATASGPGARSGAAMAYHGPTGRVLLHGIGANPLDTNTWAWDGVAWSVVATSGPSPRAHAAMAYDVGRSKTVLHGGLVGSSALGDTWEWDGLAWTPRVVAGPPARFAHAMAYDEAHQQVVVFGGRSGTTSFGDTWLWNGSEWSITAVGAPAPSPRLAAAMAYDSTRSRALLFGGGTGLGTNYADTWEWDGASWTPVPTLIAPSARLYAASAFDQLRRRWVLFGSNVSSDTWVFAVRGNPCTAGWQCNSGYCTDGVCCDRLACGTCERCDLAGSDGLCTPITGSDDSCSDGKSCIVKTSVGGTIGVCGFPLGASCGSDGDCHTGNCVDGVCCDSACTGDCQRCDLPATLGTCIPVPLSDASRGRGDACGEYVCSGASPFCQTTCTQDAFCASDHYCDASGHCAPRKAQGATCNVAAGIDCLVHRCRACDSDNCVDGVCCDSFCDGGCQACTVTLGATVDGQCATRAVGTQGRTACGAYLCGGDPACRESCASDADCINGGADVYCIDGICQGQLPVGLACAAADDCASGHCVDGVCCDSACDGVCAACNLFGALGTCTVTPIPRDGDCAGQGACRGTCEGTLPSDARCRYPSVDSSCDVCLSCDGAGACNRLPSTRADAKCPAISCASLDGECRHYRPTTTVPQCVAAGVCATSSDPSACTDDESIADGTACSVGICKDGECIPAPGAPPSSCTLARHAPAPQWPVALFLFLFLTFVRRRA